MVNNTKEMEKFLAEEFEKERKKRGWRFSQAQWSKLLGVSQQSLSQWMNGLRLPTGENVFILADKLGPRVYDILGEPRRMPDDPGAQKIIELYYSMNEKERQELLDFADKMGESESRAHAQAQ